MLEEAAPVTLGKQRNELGDRLLVGFIGDFGKGMEPFRHGREGEEIAAAVIMERALAEEVAGENEGAVLLVPQREGEIPGETIERGVAPALERPEQRAASQSWAVSDAGRPSAALNSSRLSTRTSAARTRFPSELDKGCRSKRSSGISESG